jgi:hypothetical protein
MSFFMETPPRRSSGSRRFYHKANKNWSVTSSRLSPAPFDRFRRVAQSFRRNDLAGATPFTILTKGVGFRLTAIAGVPLLVYAIMRGIGAVSFWVLSGYGEDSAKA